MRLMVCLLGLLCGCQAAPLTLLSVVGGTTAGSTAVIQRTPIDAAWSLATGRDCSVVRLDSGQTYCRLPEAPPEAQPYCTRSLGVPDCWADSRGQPPQLGDGPHSLTPAQEADRTRRWP